jgi:predicted ArsR family transcriptional regulator
MSALSRGGALDGEAKVKDLKSVRRGLMHWLLEEGQLNSQQLALKINCDQNIVYAELVRLMARGWISLKTQKMACPINLRMRTVYGLTREGIEQAIQIEREDEAAKILAGATA